MCVIEQMSELIKNVAMACNCVKKQKKSKTVLTSVIQLHCSSPPCWVLLLGCIDDVTIHTSPLQQHETTVPVMMTWVYRQSEQSWWRGPEW